MHVRTHVSSGYQTFKSTQMGKCLEACTMYARAFMHTRTHMRTNEHKPTRAHSLTHQLLHTISWAVTTISRVFFLDLMFTKQYFILNLTPQPNRDYYFIGNHNLLNQFTAKDRDTWNWCRSVYMHMCVCVFWCMDFCVQWKCIYVRVRYVCVLEHVFVICKCVCARASTCGFGIRCSFWGRQVCSNLSQKGNLAAFLRRRQASEEQIQDWLACHGMGRSFVCDFCPCVATVNVSTQTLLISS